MEQNHEEIMFGRETKSCKVWNVEGFVAKVFCLLICEDCVNLIHEFVPPFLHGFIAMPGKLAIPGDGKCHTGTTPKLSLEGFLSVALVASLMDAHVPCHQVVGCYPSFGIAKGCELYLRH